MSLHVTHYPCLSCAELGLIFHHLGHVDVDIVLTLVNLWSLTVAQCQGLNHPYESTWRCQKQDAPPENPIIVLRVKMALKYTKF